MYASTGDVCNVRLSENQLSKSLLRGRHDQNTRNTLPNPKGFKVGLIHRILTGGWGNRVIEAIPFHSPPPVILACNDLSVGHTSQVC